MPTRRLSTNMLYTLIAVAILILVLTLIFKSRIFTSSLVKDLRNKYVLITGCDSGFGRAAAVRLDQIGLRVLATCLTEEGAERLREECSDRIHTLILDVTNSEQIQQVYNDIKRIVPAGQGLWGLINNAGIFCAVAPVEWLPLAIYKKTADVNIWGMIDVTKTFLPLIKKSRGRVVNISSIAGRFTSRNCTAYCITKYGVEAFSDGLRQELAPWGVGVSIVEPGAHSTAMVNSLGDKWRKSWEQLPNELKQDYGKEFLDENIQILEDMMPRIAKDITPVVRAMVDGIVSCSPKHRYVVGPDAEYLFVWLTYLPSWLEDWLLSKVVKAAVPQACKQP